MTGSRAQWLHGALGALCALGAAVLVEGLTALGAVTPLEWMTYDARVRAFNADRPAPPEVAVVLIDEASLQYMNSDAGRWPWPRSVHADLLDFLALGQPRAVVFDVLFVERQRDSEERGAVSRHDLRLIEATAQTGLVTHAVQLLSETADDLPRDARGCVSAAEPGDCAETAAARHLDLPAAFREQYSLRSLVAPNHVIVSRAFNDIELPIPGLWEAARHAGVVRAEADADGRYRRMQLLYPYGGEVLPSLALAPVLDVLRPTRITVESNTLALDALRIPLDRNGQLLVNQYGVFHAYSYGGLIASLKQLNSGDVEHLIVDPNEFKDRIVFVGADAVGVQDLKATPLSPKTAGVYLQASIAGNLLRGDFLQPAARSTTLSITLVMALFGAFGALLFRHVSLKLAVLAGVAALYVAAAYYAFSARWVLDIVAPVTATVTAWFMAFSYLFFTEGKDKRRVRKVLAQYVSPAVLAEVVDKYANVMQVGRKENVSVLFSDIRGFTTLSETLTPEKVVEMLNLYFSEMTDVIFSHQGTIDKFIGDAIMAFWGAPIRDERHAIQSVQAALDMMRALPKVNTAIQARGIPDLHIGIGIHTGEAVLGNIGSEKKLAYTAIGDNVNLASRLEGLTKQYGCAILISETTQEQIRDLIPCRVIDAVRVKGKTLPIRIYAPLPADTPQQIETARALCEQTTEAFEHYQQRRFDAALACYRALPPDDVRELFITRCLEYLATPPDSNWDGIFTLTSK